MKVTLEFSEEVVSILNIPKNRLPFEIQVQLALDLYEKGKLSFGKARELSGLSVWEFMERLRKNRIPIKYDIADFENDLETIEKL